MDQALKGWDSTGQTYWINLDGTIQSINFSAGQHFHMTPAEAIGRNIYDMMPEHIAIKRRKIVDRVASTGRSYQFVDTYGESDVISRIVPLFDENQEVNRVLLFISKIEPPKRDVLWERLMYSWGSAKLSAKLATMLGLWFVGLVSNRLFFARVIIVALAFVGMALTANNHLIMLINSYMAGGTIMFLICGTILRYFIIR